jgi:hypothetical protein
VRATVTLSSSGDGGKSLKDSLAALTHKQILVGIPATTAKERIQDIIAMAGSATGRRKESLLRAAASNILNNAELVYIHTNGSYLRNIPARPIIEPAITDRENSELIVSELKLAAQASLSGNSNAVTQYLNRAGLIAQNVVRAWFTNPKNHWAPNAPSTIARKGSDKPLIEFGEMRKALTYVLEEGL